MIDDRDLFFMRFLRVFLGLWVEVGSEFIGSTNIEPLLPSAALDSGILGSNSDRTVVILFSDLGPVS